LLLKREGTPMFSIDLTTRQREDWAVVALRGQLDVTDAASTAAALIAIAADARAVIIDLAALEFIDSSGLAALGLVRRHARQAGGDLLLVAPQRQVLRFLTVTRLIDVFSVHACVQDAASSAASSTVTAPAAVPGLLAAT
jgi:anti-sigma B factor antagonist